MKVQRVNLAIGLGVTKGERHGSSDQDAVRKEDKANLDKFGMYRVVLVCRHEVSEARQQEERGWRNTTISKGKCFASVHFEHFAHMTSRRQKLHVCFVFLFSFLIKEALKYARGLVKPHGPEQRKPSAAAHSTAPAVSSKGKPDSLRFEFASCRQTSHLAHAP